jgi:2-acylglycerol O-acyltransferase 2
MPTLFGIDFAPAVIPLHRRLQTAALLAYTSLYLVLLLIFILVSTVLLFTPLGFIPFLYSAWIVYDTVWMNISSRGGRKVLSVRYSRFWHLFRDYFPIHLEKTADLDPSKNYIFGCHPHGIMGCGVILNFATEANGFSQLFPGIEPYVMTLKVNFYMPLMREFLLALGKCKHEGVKSA